MKQPQLILIAAVARNGVIGRENTLPWRLKADLAHFKRTTLGSPVIMGRKTWESLGRPLPGRLNIVVSRNSGYDAPGATVVSSIDAALAACSPAEQVFLIGGAQLYAQSIARADRLILTEVDARIEGDAHFPPVDPATFREVSRQHLPADADNDYAMDFVEYERTAT
ncbi:type 3 dihydrofolate reductase [Nitrogeniibacter mangrovi]|uniref:Dihydrofolate reductase n=1 Tax=Nitrogeniibacter mangrovi TaxID=2016596 RepID=A0A6C1B5B1_9RHOO|nr:type 3 dihydrofolate reductase [Nitrogeniibacter mangrovi]QID18906.1 type 3 dihydrofolate reductase [Nitrogeniibacter mangrovi]